MAQEQPQPQSSRPAVLWLLHDGHVMSHTRAAFSAGLPASLLECKGFSAKAWQCKRVAAATVKHSMGQLQELHSAGPPPEAQQEEAAAVIRDVFRQRWGGVGGGNVKEG